ncbi:MAG: DNA polymerase III subunit gamma/tau [Rhodospirillales bacterium 24-66-33]|jgi:DNA polymerase-3 subunit gamma/tau|uniref:DNA polymerase III subunit gamma/tau n=1 Tax=Reyranella sp. TaxID=1929291 RepID=UPI000BD9E45C|nr:DNA polymerase III subunit gamma/tau [Reyranella sp.]OYY41126.1 MAG: DNA polymerase III subunit gamma/tau [Rhodospirillales bacterium 35-66-84]OYZ96095.1 MAG: DNA polymerase III subunit gamma/tau [Rhodospirillales bacterium 24-66-33]OZB25943.1 MAG: DNA polymerase III subunit gamma/tau [Rhodospirillales bacterium 39-66-50]HQS14835.1 DNA polymerase III subunit gamma/tau [Reyranella sp.]HQT14222.1 DNA polymerase III subunit gamma/tau [Reyranella sp.]
MAEATPGSDPATPYRVLARKYRPVDFTTLVGQEAMVRTLRNAIATGRIAHAFMLTGVRGVGKTTTARIIARALNCVGPDGTGGPTVDPCGVCDNCKAITEDRHVDVIEMDAASRTGIDDVRELIEGVRYRPVSARYKVYIIDEVHMLSEKAFNALLKTLEEPPPHVKFLFATTEIRKVPVTVLSRCQRFDLKRVPLETLVDHFAKIAQAEKVEISPEALTLIARAADGSVRDGLSMLDQAIAHGGGVVDAAQVRDMLGLADRSRVLELFEKTMRGDAPGMVAALGEMHDSGADPVVVLQDLLELTHWVTRLKVAPDAAAATADSERAQGLAMAGKLSMASLTRAWTLLLKGLQETLAAPSPLRAAEMALIRLCYVADLPSPGDAIKMLQNGGGVPAGTAAPAMPRGNGGGGAVARLATQPVAAVAAQPAQAMPAPRSFAEVVALFESRREPRMVHSLMHHVHEVRCEPGLIEFRPEPKAPPDLAPRLSELLSLWTGRRWIASVSSAEGKPTLMQQKAAKADDLRSSAENNELVMAILKTFPGAKLEAVKRKGEQTSMLGEFVSDEPPPAEEYPADDDIPESEF